MFSKGYIGSSLVFTVSRLVSKSRSLQGVGVFFLCLVEAYRGLTLPANFPLPSHQKGIGKQVRLGLNLCPLASRGRGGLHLRRRTFTWIDRDIMSPCTDGEPGDGAVLGAGGAEDRVARAVQLPGRQLWAGGDLTVDSDTLAVPHREGLAAGLGGWATRGGGANATTTACAVPAGAAGCPTVAFDVESDAYSWPAASACLCSEESCARAASRARIGSASS